MKKLTFLIVFLLTISFSIPGYTQVYFGGGYTDFYSDDFFFNNMKGVSIDLQKEIPLGENSKWSVVPIIHIGILYSRIDNEILSNYTTSFSFTPAVSYRVLKWGIFELSAFGGPFANYVLGLQGGDPLLFESSKRSYFRAGAEFGISSTFHVTDNFSIKLVPFSAQFGNRDFRNGLFSIYFSLQTSKK